MLAGVFPLKMARIANQIVTVCAYLSNFHPTLVPVPDSQDKDDSDDSSDSGNSESE